MLNIVVLVSGNGSNLQALIQAQQAGQLVNGHLSCVISSNPHAFACIRAKQANIPCMVITPEQYPDSKQYSQALLLELNRQQADLIVLAGFTRILDKQIIEAYPYQIMNVHPSLIPSFCGVGCYGLRVHEQALSYGVKITGATVHFVNEQPDAGAIILQQAVIVKASDTPKILQQRVMEQAEWILLPRAVNLFCNQKISISNDHAIVLEDQP